MTMFDGDLERGTYRFRWLMDSSARKKLSALSLGLSVALPLSCLVAPPTGRKVGPSDHAHRRGLISDLRACPRSCVPCPRCRLGGTVRRIWPGLALLDDRPRKALGYRKPSEVFAKLVAMTP
jgi:hypothetical protein